MKVSESLSDVAVLSARLLGLKLRQSAQLRLCGFIVLVLP